MKKLLSIVLALAIGASAGVAAAQQSGSSPQSGSDTSPQASPRSTAGGSGETVMTIDCPPATAAKAAESTPSASPVGTPSGTGSGSGIQAQPSQGGVQHIEGEIKQIDSSRTERAVDLGDAKLWVEPSTVILLDCQKASLTDLKSGTKIKAAYEEKEGRKVAKVIEAKH